MLTLRQAEERGTGDHGWLYSKHTFSFAGYHDPQHMGFRTLRVINEDRVEPGHGFGRHPHRDMEIISYVLDGALEHADSMGNGSVIRPGDVQLMSAGRGVTHSEYNHSREQPVHFLQIWIEPNQRGLQPSYAQQHFSEEERRGRWRLVASADGREGSVLVHQDVRLYAALLDAGQQLSYAPEPGRHLWLHVAKGSVSVNGKALSAGDALSTSDSEQLLLADATEAEVLLFDLG